MSVNHQIIIAGFGGQGILFAGKFLTYAGLMQNYQVAWLPSYGPEMRGGTANCNVIISDEPIGSPIITDPTAIVVMNGPSLDKFEDTLVPNGKAFVDSALITRKLNRTDVDAFYVPATQIALDKGLKGLANMIMMGKVLKEMNIADETIMLEALKKTVPAKKAEMFELNLNAIKIGMDY